MNANDNDVFSADLKQQNIMEAISKLINEYENKLIDIERSRESDNKAGDHSFYMEYDTSKENINEFIGELKKLQALFI
jgi:transcription initiation factor IIE alpha subunit